MSRIVAWSIHLPGGPLTADLGGPRLVHVDGVPPPESAREILGRKGLLYKEPATLLALCAVHRALGLPDGGRPPHDVDPGTAVVACSNLGNVQTVADIARTVADEGGRAVSPLAAPNASSNVIASTVAIWFGFGGPNLMMCSGPTAGIDGLAMAGLLLRAGRARRVVVVGAEAADTAATSLYSYGDTGRKLRSGAACVVLESGGGDPVLEVAPAGTGWPHEPTTTIGAPGWDPTVHWGDCYGGQGVVSTALAAAALAAGVAGPIGVTCGDGPVLRRALVHAGLDGGDRG